MWLFGYGSLMGDGWQKQFSCARIEKATLDGYHRDFNKSSVVNWGSAQAPGPTLGLEPGGECVGLAFEFPEDKREAILSELKPREGSSFVFEELSVLLGDGQHVPALVPVNKRTGANYLGGRTLDERVALARAAKGSKGSCRDYVRGVYDKLAALGIDDQTVKEFWARLSDETPRPDGERAAKTSPTSAEGGRRGWQGLRFEAAFAVLNLVSTSLGKAPLGLDGKTKRGATDAAGLDIRFKPQADGAVDDLVGLAPPARVVAYQLKSGLGQLPQKSDSESATVDALEQAGREFRDVNGAEVVVVVFDRLSPRLHSFAQWLAGDDQLEPTVKAKTELAKILGFDPQTLDWETIRPRLRIVAMGSTADVGAIIDTELATTYASPADRMKAADALLQLIALESDVPAAGNPPIDQARLREWFKLRNLRPLARLDDLDRQIPALIRTTERFLQGVKRNRGALPEVIRTRTVDAAITRLAAQDLVLVGGGGRGKTEIEAQIVRRYLSEGWMPVVIRRADIAHSGGDLGSVVGAGGSTGVSDLVKDLIGQKAPERVLVVIDGVDEVRRTDSNPNLLRSLFQTIAQLRLSVPQRDSLHMVVSCRTFDWDAIGRAGFGDEFERFEIPPLTSAEIAALGGSAADDLTSFVQRIAEPVLSIALDRPILLRLAYELWLQRIAADAAAAGAGLRDIETDVALWTAYYRECVCQSETGLVAYLSTGDVMKCHDEMARSHIDGHLFSLSVPAAPLERNHPRAFAWLRSVEVAVSEQSLTALRARFFHSTYADYALAQSIAEDSAWRRKVAAADSLAIPLYPVWRRVPGFWMPDSAAQISGRVAELIRAPSTSALTSRALVEGCVLFIADDSTLAAIADAVVGLSPPLVSFFISMMTERALRSATLGSATSWVGALAARAEELDDESFDQLGRKLAQILDAHPNAAQTVDAAQALALAGFKRAGERAATNLANARILARNVAALFGRIADAEEMRRAPIERSSWASAGDDANAASIASEVRFAILQPEILDRFCSVSSEATADLLLRTIATLPGADAEKISLSRFSQTEISFTTDLAGLWAMSWHLVEQSLPRLLQRDAEAFLPVAVVAWTLVGRAWAAEDAERAEQFPVAVDGHYWLHDASGWWWTESAVSRQSDHGRIALEGFEFVRTELQRGGLGPFTFLADLAKGLKWAGLAAVALEIAESAFHSDLTPEAARAVAITTLDLISLQRAFFVPEMRHAIATILPQISLHLDQTQRDEVSSMLRNVAAPGRIAATVLPVVPDLEMERAEHAVHLTKARNAVAAEKPGTRAAARAQLSLSFLEQKTGDAIYEMKKRLHEAQLKWKNTAERGETPLDHPDVQWCLSVFKEFEVVGRLDLLPADLQQLHRMATAALGDEHRKRSRPMVQQRSSVRPIFPPSRESFTGRALLCFDLEALEARLRDRTTPWSPLEATILRAVIEISRRDAVANVEENSSGTSADDEESPSARGRQPFPKRAWLQIVLQYLTLLETDVPHGFSRPTVETVMDMATDADPSTARAASYSVPFTVRGLVAESLSLLSVHGGPVDARDLFLMLSRDATPQVRRCVYVSVPRLRRRDPDLYRDVLAAFSTSEDDPFLLCAWGFDHIFYGAPTDAEAPAWDQAAETLVGRFNSAAQGALGGEVATQWSREATTRLSRVLAHLAIRGFPKSTDAVRRVLCTPAGTLRLPGLVAAIGQSAIEHIDALEQYIDPALQILKEYTSRSRTAVDAMEQRQSEYHVPGELAVVTEIVGMLGGAVIGIEPVITLALSERDLDAGPRRSRLSANRQLCDAQIQETLFDFADPWCQSKWLPYLQRALLDLLFVLRQLVSDDPNRVAQRLIPWRVADSVVSLETRVKDELVALLGELLAAESLLPSNQETVTRLLQTVASTGHRGAVELVHRLASLARQQ